MSGILVVSVLNGLAYGLLLFLLSSGLTLIFSMMGVLNFAHASFYMLGAYVGFQLTGLLGFWAALVIAPLVVGLLGAAVERYGLRRAHAHGHLAELLFTFGIAFLIQEVVQLIWGRAPVEFRMPEAMYQAAFQVGGLDYPAYRLLMAALSIGSFLLLFLYLTRTRVGLVIQAALTHPQMVASLGHNVPLMFMLVFGLGTALAGLAGVVGGSVFVTEPGMAQELGAIVFVVIVVGGLGSLWGAFVASLLLGLIQTLAVGYDRSLIDLLGLFGHFEAGPNSLLAIKLSQIAPILPYLLLTVMLVVRPRGIAGKRDS